jgi:hypothetical protein
MPYSHSLHERPFGLREILLGKRSVMRVAATPALSLTDVAVLDSNVSDGEFDSDVSEDKDEVDLKRKHEPNRDSPCSEQGSKKRKEDKDTASRSEKDLPRQELFVEDERR